jgi:hypothetical protein
MILKKLDAKDRLNVITRLLPYVMPAAEFDLNKMSESDLDVLIERLKDKSLPKRQNLTFEMPVRVKEVVNS